MPTIGLRFDRVEVPARLFLRAARALFQLVRAFERSRRRETKIVWSVARRDLRVATVAFEARDPGHREPAVATIGEVLSCLRQLEESARYPLTVDGRALQRARTLGAAAGAAGGRIEVWAGDASGEREVFVTVRSATHAERLARRPNKETGSVEGRMEGLTIHGPTAFFIYDALTGTRVECRCDRGMLDRAAAHLGKRMIATGKMRYGKDGKLATVLVDSFRLLGVGPLPQPEDIVGLLKDHPISIPEWSRYVREKWIYDPAGESPVGSEAPPSQSANQPS